MTVASPKMSNLLSVEAVTVRFEGVTALADVSFAVRPGELFAIIGPNGAGKTSLFNVLSRVYQPASGRVTFAGRDLLKVNTNQVARAGIARTFQSLGQFPHTTVIDYLLLGRHIRMRSGILLGGLYVGPTSAEERKNREYCMHLLELVGLQQFSAHPLGSLPFGLQKRADLARALAAQPRLLLLDEPVAGMGLEESRDLAAILLDIK
ncbi:MAG: ABC transporter ATP-binding protein, partial [Ktedonobacterales bacterium]